MRALLRHHDYRLLLAANFVSCTGDWILNAGLTYQIYVLTGSTLASATMVLAVLIPKAALGSLAGVLADRWDRRRTMIGCNVLLAATLLPLLLVSHPRQAPIVYVVTAAQSALAALFTSAEAALVPSLVDGSALVTANALNGQAREVARLAGAAAGGVLAAAGGIPLVAAADAVTFAAAAGLLALIRHRAGRVGEPAGGRGGEPAGGRVGEPAGVRAGESLGSPAAEPAGVRAGNLAGGRVRESVDSQAGEPAEGRVGEPAGGRAGEAAASRLARQWWEGARVAVSTRTLRVLMAFVLVTGVGEAVMMTLMAPFVRDVLGGGAAAYGAVMAAQAVGGLAGGLVATLVGHRFPARLLLGAGATAFGLLDLVLFLYPLVARVLWPAVVIMVIVGLPAALCMAGLVTTFQTATGDEHRGRVFGAMTALQAAAMLAGTAVAGVLADRAGIVPVIALQGAGYCVAGLLILVALPVVVPASARGRTRAAVRQP